MRPTAFWPPVSCAERRRPCAQAHGRDMKTDAEGRPTRFPARSLMGVCDERYVRSSGKIDRRMVFSVVQVVGFIVGLGGLMSLRESQRRRRPARARPRPPGGHHDFRR